MYHTNRTDRHPAATFDKFERFENWLRSNGAKFDQVCSDIVLFVCLFVCYPQFTHSLFVTVGTPQLRGTPQKERRRRKERHLDRR